MSPMRVRRTDPIAPLPQEGGFWFHLPIENELRLAEVWFVVRWGRGHLRIRKVRRVPMLVIGTGVDEISFNPCFLGKEPLLSGE